MRSPRAFLFIPGLSLLLVATGCRDREITAYRAPKDPAPVEMPAAGLAGTNDLPSGHPPIGPVAGDGSPGSMADTAVPTASGADLSWTAPATWQAKPLSAMRKGSFNITGDGAEADMSIIAFPGDVGGLAANLNRWRGQAGLDLLPPGEVAAATEKFAANGLDFVVADYAGGGKRLLGAIVPFGGNSWFFKLMGPDALVESRKAEFMAFLHTVKENAGASSVGSQSTSLATGDASTPSMADTAVPTASGAELAWTAPASWQAKPLSAMRKGSFNLAGDGAEADFSITAFPGAVGGLEANLNRWRGQVGLDPLAPDKVASAAEKFAANGLEFVVVDYSGGGKRLLGAVVPYGGNSWFFKLMGPDALVESRKAEFMAFLHTVRAR